LSAGGVTHEDRGVPNLLLLAVAWITASLPVALVTGRVLAVRTAQLEG
jgi:hypothetical protein